MVLGKNWGKFLLGLALGFYAHNAFAEGETRRNESENLPRKSKLFFSLGASSWQEDLSIATASRSTKLRSTNIASYLDFTFFNASRVNEFGVNLNFFFAKADVVNAHLPSGNDIEYAVSRVNSGGGMITPFYYIRPAGGWLAFGAGVPVMLRYANFPSVGSNYTVGPRFKVLVGGALETRFERKSFYFGQRVGFFQIPKSLFWSLGIGWRLL
jgi:hypothetical protein